MCRPMRLVYPGIMFMRYVQHRNCDLRDLFLCYSFLCFMFCAFLELGKKLNQPIKPLKNDGV